MLRCPHVNNQAIVEWVKLNAKVPYQVTYGFKQEIQDSLRKAGRSFHHFLSSDMQDAVRAEVELVLAGLGDLPDRRRHGLAEKVRRDRAGYEN